MSDLWEQRLAELEAATHRLAAAAASTPDELGAIVGERHGIIDAIHQLAAQAPPRAETLERLRAAWSAGEEALRQLLVRRGVLRADTARANRSAFVSRALLGPALSKGRRLDCAG